MTDRQLMARLVMGDVTALNAFHRRFASRITAVARGLVRNEWDAEEVLQDVVWTVFRKADSFRGDSSVWSWVYRITQNCARMLLRKRKRVPLPLEASVLEGVIDRKSSGTDDSRPESLMRVRLASEGLFEAFDGMGDVNQRVFMAADVDGASMEEISERVGLSVSAVKARLHRVRGHLRAAAERALEAA